jgi:hypothetical protein
MKTTVNVSQFRDAFRACDRQDQFSYEALGLLFNYFEDLEDSTGQEIELDPIAICCDYSEDSPADIARNYLSDDAPQDDCAAMVEAYLLDHTSVVGTTKAGDIVYLQF